MSPRKKVAGLSLISLILTYEFHVAALALALGNNRADTYSIAEYASDYDFLRKQLEKGIPPEAPLLERSYVVPSEMNLSLADEIWLKIAPLISLGYSEKEITDAIGKAGLPRSIEVDGLLISLDYANLRVTRNLNDGEVSVEIPIICNSSLSSIHYVVKGVKKHVKLYNITSTRYYNVSVRASDLYEVTYSDGLGGFHKAISDLSGNLKDNIINVYFPGLHKPNFSEIRFDFPSCGIGLSLRVLERKVYNIDSNEGRVDCYWFRVNATLKAIRDVFWVSLLIGHGDLWRIKHWLMLRKGEYSWDHWVKWTPNDKLIVKFLVGGFRNTFILNFGDTPSGKNDFLSRVLSEDELRNLLKQPPYVKLNLSKAPGGFNVKFANEKITNETIWVCGKEYERLVKLGWREAKSLFIDSGEVEWEYEVTNETLGQYDSIKLFYNPLKVKRGELVHGLILRNYADANLSYSLRLRTTAGFFFSKVEEGNGNIILSKASTNSLLLIQQEPALGDAVLELVKDGRVVAGVRVSLALKATMFWKGFWDGLATKLPGILITAGVMVAMGFLIPKAYVRPVYYLLLGLGVLSNILEVTSDIAEANRAKAEMLALAEVLENRSREFIARSEAEHAAECMSFAFTLRREVNETMNNLLLNVISDLAIGVSFDEIWIALGLKEPLARDEFERQYKIGYARGRVTGAVISGILYITLLIMVNRIKVERIGQRLTAGQVLKLIVRGIYNWITPAIWDAIVLACGKIKGFTNKVVDLLLGNKYSRRFGDAIGNLLQDAKGELPRIRDTLDISSGISKNVLENVPSRESSKKILDVIGSIVKLYSLEELKEKGRTITRSIVSMWIKGGDETIDNLNDWLNGNPDKIRAFADEILVVIKEDAAEDVGLKIGDIATNYFDIKSKYGEEAAKTFLNLVLKSPEKLESILKSLRCKIFAKTHSVTLKRDEAYMIVLDERFEKGVYIVRVYFQHGDKSSVIEFPISTKGSSVVTIPADKVNKILNSIGSNEARIEITKIIMMDYRLSFISSFWNGQIELDLFNNEIMLGRERYKCSVEAGHGKEGIFVEVTVKSGNTQGKSLVLVFHSNGKVAVLHGEHKFPLESIEIDAEHNAVKVTYEMEREKQECEYSLWSGIEEVVVDGKKNRKLVNIDKRLQWEEKIGERTAIGLKQNLLILLGYEAYGIVKEEIGKNYFIIVEYDNGKIASTKDESIAVKVPEGAKETKAIYVFSLEISPVEGPPTLPEVIKKKVINALKEVIKHLAEGSLRAAADPLGTAGEYAVHVKSSDNILNKLGKALKIPENELEAFKNAVNVELRGELNPDKGSADIIIKAKRDITINGRAFKSDDVIAIVEVKSTVRIGVDTFPNAFKEMYDDAVKSLRDHIKNYRTATYGVIVILGYNPEMMLLSMHVKDEPFFPVEILTKEGIYENPYIEVLPREKILPPQGGQGS